MESSQEPPRHRAGDAVRLLDMRLELPEQRDFQVVGVSRKSLSGFVETGMSWKTIYVLLTDAQSTESE